MSKSLELFLGSVLAASVLAGPAMAEKLGLGRVALPEEISAWDTAVLPDGQGLRPGSGDVATGDALFADNCASCHGDFAEGLDSWPVLAGGDGSLTDPRPVKTIGSYWPYLSTVYDYVHRSMPFGSAQTLSVDDTYAITAFLLYSNGLVEDDFVLTHENFTKVVLPNAEGFYPDDRDQSEYPLFSKEPCMTDCAVGVEITKRAVDLNVTPEDPDGRPAGSMPNLGAAAEPAEPAAPVEKKAEAAPAEAPAQAAPEVVVKTAAAAPETPAPAEAAAAADPALLAQGEKVFKKCAACHKVGDGAKNSTGPTLNGIVGSPAGKVEGFKYSKPLLAMAADGLVWDDASLHTYLESPKGMIKGGKMSFAGLKKEDDRAAVIAYLATFAK
ncbi:MULTISPECIES: c-type cytochrome [Paracoccus]|uniref:Sulfur dehydrogenase subunit SoxD n=1 Tax=Paracoccus versutus TaxID=34007 RepID=A0A3D9XZ68_PARVE|nr:MULTISPECIES: c-type cytochrome [Paracoccus]REF72229.1 sulfur dehydrogenase subunit SoxD [Paracoccus versutus]WGR55784.1 c-type cytochrome [Paracoccus versutus]